MCKVNDGLCFCCRDAVVDVSRRHDLLTIRSWCGVAAGSPARAAAGCPRIRDTIAGKPIAGHAGAGPAAHHRQRDCRRRLHRRCRPPARERSGIRNHPPRPQQFLGGAADHRRRRDAGTGSAGRRPRYAVRRGHRPPARRAAARWPRRPSAWPGRRYWAGFVAQARADPNDARDDGAAEPGERRPARDRSGALGAGRGHAAQACRHAAGGGSCARQSGDQATAVHRTTFRPVAERRQLAAADPALVGPCGAYAHPFPLPAWAGGVRAAGAAAGGRRVRCDVAMVVRSAGCAARTTAPRAAAAETPCRLPGGDGGAARALIRGWR